MSKKPRQLTILHKTPSIERIMTEFDLFLEIFPAARPSFQTLLYYIISIVWMMIIQMNTLSIFQALTWPMLLRMTAFNYSTVAELLPTGVTEVLPSKEPKVATDRVWTICSRRGCRQSSFFDPSTRLEASCGIHGSPADHAGSDLRSS
jgi:hypothetical protein